MSSGFLDEILAAVRQDVRSGLYGRASAPPPAPTGPGLRASIERLPVPHGLVVEYKRASPGRPDPDLPQRTVAEFVRATDLTEVAGYSCLATRPRFEGSPEVVAELVRSTRRPVLFKDFVIGTEQLEAAREAGARAVLLIARLETEHRLEQSLARLAENARTLGLEVVLELHYPEEVGLLSAVRPELVGVNVRDLDTLRFERRRAFETLARLGAGPGVPILGLSGVEGAADAQAFWDAGCRALVVGSAVALAPDPAAFLRSLVGGVGAR